MTETFNHLLIGMQIKAMNDADAAIILVSQDFLASDYVASDELPRLLTAANERGLRIFPVFVSAWFLRDSPLLKFQGVNSPQSPLDSLEPSEQNKLLARLAASVDDLLKIASEGVTEEWLEKFRGRFEPIAGGTFVMGDRELYNKLHALQEHDVSVESFRLGRFIVTQAEWKALMNTQPWLGEKNVKYGDDIPAVYVSWYDAIDFVRTINKTDSQFNYRLPSEAEWEYAARGGQAVSEQPRSRFCFGNDANLLISYGWHDQNASLRGENYAHAVGMLRPSQLNLFDMHGDVWEWTADNLVVQHSGCDGYKHLRFRRALAIVKRQLTVAWTAWRWVSQAVVVRRTRSWVGSRWSRPCLDTTANSIAAIWSQLPCVGV